MNDVAASKYATTLRVPASHPALPGHFPGQPIAPGVLLLDLVIEAAERWLARPLALRGLPQVKFAQPLNPDEEARLELTLLGEQLRFALSREGVAIAQGVFRLALAPAA